MFARPIPRSADFSRSSVRPSAKRFAEKEYICRIGSPRAECRCNNDTGDSWEWADNPRYPQRYSDLGIRIMVNAGIYDMTH